jgi:hypothetical protein
MFFTSKCLNFIIAFLIQTCLKMFDSFTVYRMHMLTSFEGKIRRLVQRACTTNLKTVSTSSLGAPVLPPIS